MDAPNAAQHRLQVEEFRRRHRTGLVTLLFTDIVESTALKHALGDHAGTALIQQYRALVRELLRQFPESEEIETAGDSFLLVFRKPSAAVTFGLQLQHRQRQLGETSGQPVRLRIGIHLGEVVIEEHEAGQKAKDLYGVQLDICARVMSLAKANQVLMGRGVFDSARQVLKGEDLEGIGPLEWLNHGPYLLKGIEEPVEVCEVREAGQGAAGPPTSSEKAQRQVRADEEPVLGWRPAVGQTVPNTSWVLEKKLGEGGFGEVWLGRHQTMKERRVFKFCFRADRVRSLKREMTLFRVLKERMGDHPHIVRLLEVYFEEPPFYVVMDHVEGADLTTWCDQQGGVDKVPLAARLEIVAQIAEALQAAHDAGVIHRDVKPANILVGSPKSEIRSPKEDRSPRSEDSALCTLHSSLRAMLTDFGIGQVVSEEALRGVTKAGFTQTMLGSESSSQTGTQLYMAPELLAGKAASIRSDIYSLGVVLYQLLVGDFTRSVTIDSPRQITDPLLRDDLEHCLAGDPQERFAGAAVLAHRLRAYEQRKTEQKLRAAEAVERERLRQQAMHRRRLLWISAAVAGVLLIVTAALIYGLGQARKERDRQALFAYAADMRSADAAVHENNLGQAKHLLLRYLPPANKPDLRGIEWRYLWRQCQGDQTNLFAHDAPVISADVSPDGRMVASESGDKIWIWETSTKKLLRQLDSSPMPWIRQRVAFCPTGQLLAVAGPAEVVLWDSSRWEKVQSFPCPNATIAFSGNGATLAACDMKGLIGLWKHDQDKPWHPIGQFRVPTAEDGEHALALNHEGNRFAAGTWNYSVKFSQRHTNEITVWDLSTGASNTVSIKAWPPVTVAFSPDGRLLAAGTEGTEHGRVFVWAEPEHRLVLDFPAHRVMVHGLAFSPDSRLLATGGNDQLIHLWQAGTTNLLATLKGHLSAITSLHFSADGRWLVSASKDGTVRAWWMLQATNRAPSFAIPEGRLIGRLSPDGARLVTVNRADWTFEVWDTTNATRLRKVSITATNHFVDLAQETVVRYQGMVNWGARLGLGSLFTGAPLWDLVATTADGSIMAWSATNGAISYSNQVSRYALVGATPTPDGQRFSVLELVPGRGNPMIMMWNLIKNCREGAVSDYELRYASAGASSPDGRWTVYPSTNKSVVVVDLAAQRIKYRLRRLPGNPQSMAFSRDGSLLAIGTDEATAQIWSLASGKPASWQFQGHLSGVGKMLFSANGKTLVTYSDDATCRLWHVATGQEMISGIPLNDLLRTHTTLPLLSEDGNMTLEPDGEDRIRFRHLPTLAEIDAIEKTASRQR